ncbi:MAG: GntR family transcriptional regulator [Phycisphaeraceae bacterium]|nr:GntR family transcriptional regulator [Phycisphaeraceae bacterium]
MRDQIEAREFSSGQQFYTIKEICDKYRVSTSTAIRCLERLEEEGLIERRHRSGIYVKNTPSGATEAATVRCVDCVMPEDIVSRGGPEFLADEILAGTSGSRSSDELALRINLLPKQINTEEQIEAWLQQLVDAGSQAFIFRWMPTAAQRVAQRKGWPTCILGTPDRGITLPSIGFDQRQLGECIAEYLVRQDCQHVAILMRNEWRPGDNVLANSLIVGLGNRLVAIETVPPSAEDVDSALDDLIARVPRIDALFLRNHLSTRSRDRLHELTSKPQKFVVISEMYRNDPWITPIVPVGQSRVEAITSLLRRLIAGEPVAESESFPAQILEPAS